MIYCIKQQGLPICKIGYSSNPERRIAGFQTVCHVKLEIVKIIKGEIADERLLHAKFAKERLHGEWFKYSKRIQTYFSTTRKASIKKKISTISTRKVKKK